MQKNSNDSFGPLSLTTASLPFTISIQSLLGMMLLNFKRKGCFGQSPMPAVLAVSWDQSAVASCGVQRASSLPGMPWISKKMPKSCLLYKLLPIRIFSDCLAASWAINAWAFHAKPEKLPLNGASRALGCSAAGGGAGAGMVGGGGGGAEGEAEGRGR